MTLMPLQMNTVLLWADQSQAPSDPPLPPITREQTECGELASLLNRRGLQPLYYGIH